MEPRVAGAGVAMAIGLMVLLPTFNALNNSYVTDVTPPDWLAKLIDPDKIPEDFQPPPDMEPPEGWEPPPDFEPPPGWEPPPGYEGPIPPGGCPPPLVKRLDGMTKQGEIGPNWDGESWTFAIPKYTVGIAANVTFTQWQAQSVSATLDDPNGTRVEDEAAGDTGGLLSPATTQPPAEFSLQFVTDPEDMSTMPKQGNYTLGLSAQFPLSGRYTTEVVVGIACGGMLQ